MATKMMLEEYGKQRVTILRAWLADEDTEDNDRFADDCARWFGHYIITVADWRYKASAQEVFRRHRFIKNRNGAKCSKLLKHDILATLECPSDTWVIGYTIEERDRLDLLIDANNGRRILTPLIDRNLSKSDCLAILERAQIPLPRMYQLGYNNNNCKCCPKGGQGYMNRQRVDFPAHFENLCQIQDVLGPGSYLFRDRQTGVRFSLRDLPPDSGNHEEPQISCSVHCELVEQDFSPMERV